MFFFIFTFVFTVEFLNIKFGVLFYHIHESDSFILAIQNVTLGKIEKKNEGFRHLLKWRANRLEIIVDNKL